MASTSIYNSDSREVVTVGRNQAENALSPTYSFGCSLPDSILLEIFHYLSFIDRCRAAQVCRVWRRVACDNALHRVIDVRVLRLAITKVWKLIRSHCTCAVKDLRLRGFVLLLKAGKPKWKTATVSQAVLAELSHRCPQLKCLTLEEVFLAKDTNDAGVTIKDLPSGLTHLSLRYSFFHPDRFFGINPGTYLSNLRCLDLEGVTLVCSYDLRVFCTFTELRALYLEGCFRINNGGIELLTGIISQLEILDLEGTDISDDGVDIVITNCVHLKDLYLGHTRSCDEPWKSLPSGMKLSLEILCVRSTVMTDEGLDCVLKHGKKLCKFFTSGTFVTKNGLKKLKTLLPNCQVDEELWSDSKCQHHDSHKCSIYQTKL